MAGTIPGDNTCDFHQPPAGAVGPSKSHLFVQAFDSDGVAVVGSAIAARHAGDGQPARFNAEQFPVGGLASALIPTWDFGPDGIGGVAVVCGGVQSGLLDLEFQFDDGSTSAILFDPLAYFDFSLPYSIPVVATDVDGDGFLNELLILHSGPANTNPLFDNCVFGANPLQVNTDGNFVSNGPFNSVDDLTRPNSDAEGDACDDDDDNDFLKDSEELTGERCGGILTNPLDPDTDGDGVRDQDECFAFGGRTDPTDPTERPSVAACGGRLDVDGDGLSDYLESCYYGTSRFDTDTDGDAALDGATDGCEVASLNEDRIVDSGDQLLLAMEYLRVLAGGALLPNFDLTKDGRINSGDQLLMAKVMVSAVPCTDED